MNKYLKLLTMLAWIEFTPLHASEDQDWQGLILTGPALSAKFEGSLLEMKIYETTGLEGIINYPTVKIQTTEDKAEEILQICHIYADTCYINGRKIKLSPQRSYQPSGNMLIYMDNRIWAAHR